MRKKLVTYSITLLLLSLFLFSSKIHSSKSAIQTHNSSKFQSHDDWWWEPLELLSSEFDNTNYVPNIAVDDENNIHIVTYGTDDLLGSDTDRDVFYRMYDYDLKSWSDLELVSEGSSGFSEVPVIATDPSGTVHIAWRDGTDLLSSGIDSDIFYRQKTSSGWGAVELVSSESVDFSIFVAIEADSNGFAHVMWEDSATFIDADSDQDMLYKYRNAAGIWSSVEMVSDLSTEHAYHPEIKIDSEENILFAWSDYTNILTAGLDKDVFYRQLDNDLTTWSALQLISSESGDESANPRITTGSDGSIHLVWYDYEDYLESGTDADIFYRKYDPNSHSWSLTDVISTESTGHSYYADLEIDDSSDFLYLAWTDVTPVGGLGIFDNIFFKFLDLDTETWSPVSVLTNDHTGLAYYPKIDVDSLGHVHVVFLDSSDLLGAGTDQDIFYKKYVGVPMQPILEDIYPNPSSVGDIGLSWSAQKDASNFSVFRSSNPISSIAGLTAIASIVNYSYIDTINSVGNYYYAIVATNEYGDSLVSNTEYVEVVRGTGFFASLELSEIIIFAGIIIGAQLIFSVLTYMAISSKIQSTGKTKKGKK